LCAEHKTLPRSPSLALTLSDILSSGKVGRRERETEREREREREREKRLLTINRD